ncbi:MAG: AIR synthase-related protein [Promethearchaeota archaeon]
MARKLQTSDGGVAGKYQGDVIKEIIFSRLGARPTGIVLSPGIGIDFNAIRLDGETTMLVTTDPFYVNPIFGLAKGAWLGFQIILSDILMSGINPSHAIFTMSLPVDLKVAQFKAIWDVIHGECMRLGISIISGHTGAYEGINFPIIGSGTLMAFTRSNSFLSPLDIKAGDAVILGGMPANEAFVSFLMVDEQNAKSVYGEEHQKIRDQAWASLGVEMIVDATREFIKSLTTKGKTHGIKSMHDVAERGVLGAVVEMADAANLGFNLDLDTIKLDGKFSRFLNKYFSKPLEYWQASGQGAVLIASSPDQSPALVNFLRSRGIKTSLIGYFTKSRNDKNYTIQGKKSNLTRTFQDPFWPAFKNLVGELDHFLKNED